MKKSEDKYCGEEKQAYFASPDHKPVDNGRMLRIRRLLARRKQRTQQTQVQGMKQDVAMMDKTGASPPTMPSRLISRLVPINTRREDAEMLPQELESIAQGQTKMIPALFQTDATPIPALMASPGKQGLEKVAAPSGFNPLSWITAAKNYAVPKVTGWLARGGAKQVQQMLPGMEGAAAKVAPSVRSRIGSYGRELGRGQTKMIPALFQTDATPIPALMASPGKQGLAAAGLVGAAGAGLGYGAGKLAEKAFGTGLRGAARAGLGYGAGKLAEKAFGTGLHSGVAGAALGGLSLAALAGLSLAALADLKRFKAQRRRNEHLEEIMRRLPPGATRHDYVNTEMLWEALMNRFGGEKISMDKQALGAGTIVGGFHGAANAPEGNFLQNTAHGLARGFGADVGVGLGGGLGLLTGAGIGGVLERSNPGWVEQHPALAALLLGGGTLAGGIGGGIAGWKGVGKLLGKSPAKKDREGNLRRRIALDVGGSGKLVSALDKYLDKTAINPIGTQSTSEAMQTNAMRRGLGMRSRFGDPANAEARARAKEYRNMIYRIENTQKTLSRALGKPQGQPAGVAPPRVPSPNVLGYQRGVGMVPLSQVKAPAPTVYGGKGVGMVSYDTSGFTDNARSHFRAKTPQEQAKAWSMAMSDRSNPAIWAQPGRVAAAPQGPVPAGGSPPPPMPAPQQAGAPAPGPAPNQQAMSGMENPSKLAADIGHYAAAFLVRCHHLGMDPSQIKRAIDQVDARFGKEASDELYEGLEKVSAARDPRTGLLSWGMRLLPKAWQFIRGGAKPVQQMLPGMEGAAAKVAPSIGSRIGGFGRELGSNARQMGRDVIGRGAQRGPQQYLPGMQPASRMRNFFVNPDGAQQGAWNQIKNQGWSRMIGGAVTGQAMGDVNPDSYWDNVLGGLAGAAYGRYMPHMGAMGQAAGKRAFAGSMGGQILGGTTDLLGLTQNAGATGAQLGGFAGFGSAMVPGMRPGQLAPWAQREGTAVSNLLEKPWQARWMGMHPGDMLKNLGKGSNWLTAVGTVAGPGARLASDVVAPAAGMGVDALLNKAEERMVNLVQTPEYKEYVKSQALEIANTPEFQEVINTQGKQAFYNILAEKGITPQQFDQMLQSGKGLAGMGGLMSGITRLADQILGAFGMDVQAMDPMMKIAILLGGGALLGGGIGGMMGGGGGAALGGLGALGGLALMGGMMGGGRQAPGTPAAAPGGLGAPGTPAAAPGGPGAPGMVWDPYTGLLRPMPQQVLTPAAPIRDELEVQQRQQ